MRKPKRKAPIFKRGDRVEWQGVQCPGHCDAPMRMTGVVADVHRLGAHGLAYEVRPDGGGLPEEIMEVDLAHASVLDRMAQAAAEGDAQSTGEKPKRRPGKRK